MYLIILKNVTKKESKEIILFKTVVFSDVWGNRLDFYDKDSTLGMIIGDR